MWVLLGFIGLFVGAFGTLIGAAGGFILVPILLFLYPGETPATITSITLTVAFFNALSGSIAYGHLKRIDYRSGLLFSVAAVPGSIIGATITLFISRGVFQYMFGAVLLLVAGYLIIRPNRPVSIDAAGPRCVVRTITDRQNRVYTYSFKRPRGIAIAFVVGFFAGMLSIGGGIIHVPALTQLLNFPTHVASATSHFIVAITSLSAIGTHIVTGVYNVGVHRALVLSAGALIGAQFGARLSQRVSGTLIIRLLSIGLAMVALRLLIAPF